jgi:hypothetical protein
MLLRGSQGSIRLYIDKMPQQFSKPVKSLILKKRSVFRKRVVKAFNKVKLFLKLVSYAASYL